MISVDASVEKWGGNFICTGLCQLRRRGGRQWQGKSRSSIESRRRGVKKQNGETKRNEKQEPSIASSFSFSFVFPKNSIGTSFLSRDLLFPDFIAYSAFSFRGNAE